MKATILGTVAALLTVYSVQGGVTPNNPVHPKVTISVANLTTGQPIRDQQTVAAGDLFQVTVTTNGVDCAGQFAVTALGAPGFPPSAPVQVLPFTIGPAVGSNSVTGGTLSAGVLPDGTNSFKISSSCSGAARGQFHFDRFEFFVR